MTKAPPKKSHMKLRYIIQCAHELDRDPIIRGSEQCRIALMNIRANSNIILNHVKEIIWENRKYIKKDK